MVVDKEIIVVSLGGSLLVPDHVDGDFLHKFVSTIRNSGKRFVLICGGGATCRTYVSALQKIRDVEDEDADWLGIFTTRLNAEYVRMAFGDDAYDEVATDPTDLPEWNTQVLVCSGWKPGRSTDYVAVTIAEEIGAKEVINLSAIDHVYNKNPKDHKDAKPIEDMHWDELCGIVGDKWNPAMNAPFDPIASKKARELGLIVYVLNGRNSENVLHCIEGKKFVGTTIKN